MSLNAAKTSQRDQHRIPTGEDAHSWVVFNGTCVKVTSSRMVPSTKSYECGKCKKITVVPADPEQYNACPMPAKCFECSQVGAMRLVMEGENNKPVCTFKDSQEIKVQEKLSNVGLGSIPRSIWVCLDDDLADRCKPGDDVQIQGMILQL